MTEKRGRVAIVVSGIVFACYIVLLLKILFFSRVSIPGLFNGQPVVLHDDRSINIIPFRTIIGYLSGNNRTAFGNIAGNIALFVPLGIYVTLFRKNKKVLAGLLVAFLVSLSVEIIQWIFAVGASDIDDVILNCVGALIGIALYKLIALVARDESKTRIIVAVLSVVL